MFSIKSRCAGFSLIELMLVLVVMAGITIASVRQFNQYKMYTKAEQIKGSVDFLMDLLTRYYQATCQTLDQDFKRKDLSKNDFVNAELVSTKTYDAMVKFPWKGSSYSMSLEWQLVDASNGGSQSVMWGVWVGTVAFTFPTDITSNLIDSYSALLQPSAVENKPRATMSWMQPVNLGWGKVGGLVPLSEDLNRFTVQTYVPDTPSFAGDYDSSFRPNESTQQPCSVLERQRTAKESDNDHETYLDDFERIRQIR